MANGELPRPALNAPTPILGRIEIVVYEQGWPTRFTLDRDRILDALGNRALEIHHIGSTAVPGLAAKPVIDILVVVANATDDGSYIPDLEASGYVLRRREPDVQAGVQAPETDTHRLLKTPNLGVNVHVYSAASPAIGRHLVFRDWLRAHPADAFRYQQAKFELAARNWTYAHEYAEAKTGIILEILAKALA